jgi:hypothetical protein
VQYADNSVDLVRRQCGLDQIGHSVAVDDLHPLRVGDGLHQDGAVGAFAHGADRFVMSVMADEQNGVVVIGEAARLGVYLADQWAGSVDDLQPPLRGLRSNGRRHPVRGEDHSRPVGHVAELIDEYGSGPAQLGDHVAIVDDLLTHVDRGTALLQRVVDDVDGAYDAGAERVGSG